MLTTLSAVEEISYGIVYREKIILDGIDYFKAVAINSILPVLGCAYLLK